MTVQFRLCQFKGDIMREFTLEDQARGRCPYCGASADEDCDCEKG